MKNRIMIFLLSVSFMLIGSFGAVFFYYNNSTNVVLEQTNDYFESITSAKANHVSTYLKGEVARGESFAYQPVYKELLRMSKGDVGYEKLYEKVYENVDGIVEEFAYLELDLWDKDGIAVVSSTRELEGFDYSEYEFYVEGKKGAYMDLFYNPTPGIEVNTLGITLPIFDNGELLGIFAISMALDDFNKIPLDRTGLGDTGEVYIINKDFLMITSSRFFPEEETFLKRKIDTAQSRSCVDGSSFAGNSGFESTHPFVYENIDGIEVLGTHTYVTELSGCLILEMNKSEAIGSHRTELLRSAFFILIITSVFMIVFIFISNKVLLGEKR